MPLRPDPGVGGSGINHVPNGCWSGFADGGYCGVSFNLGVLRFHDADSAAAAREWVAAAFPRQWQAGWDVLAFDWRGRQVVTTGSDDSPLQLADVGRGEIEAFVTIAEFSQMIRPDGGVELLFGAALFEEWKQQAGAVGLGLAFTDCLELQVPVFAGGTETVDNLTPTTVETSWKIGAALLDQVRDLPPGAPIRFSVVPPVVE
ncbi:MAG: hypothetical protein DI570_30810 [Phenylobacterium zucineum]|nr:MAG: hypothetical protein DI570_30810 [Phenylobacterium zucineum]